MGGSLFFHEERDPTEVSIPERREHDVASRAARVAGVRDAEQKREDIRSSRRGLAPHPAAEEPGVLEPVVRVRLADLRGVDREEDVADVPLPARA